MNKCSGLSRKPGRLPPAAVTEMVRKYLTPDKMTIVVVGDKSKIDAQIKRFDVP